LISTVKRIYLKHFNEQLEIWKSGSWGGKKSDEQRNFGIYEIKIFLSCLNFVHCCK